MEPQKKPIHLNEMIPHIFTNPFETRCRQNGRIRRKRKDTETMAGPAGVCLSDGSF